MAKARRSKPPEVAALSLEEIAERYIGRFRDKRGDWEAFEDAKTEATAGRSIASSAPAAPASLDGYLMVFVENERGRRVTRTLGPWECIACPPGVIHGYQNESLEPVYFQVMLGRARREAMGYADDELYRRREAHLVR